MERKGTPERTDSTSGRIFARGSRQIWKSWVRNWCILSSLKFKYC